MRAPTSMTASRGRMLSVCMVVLATTALLYPVSALNSDVGKKLAVVESDAQSPQAVQQSQVQANHAAVHDQHANHEHDDDDDDDEDNDTVVRCRFCGATVAFKKDYIGLHDTSKAVASKRESVLGDNGELHTFVNPSRVEMELAGFKTARGLEADMYTKKASFFEQYNWRDLRCSSCKRHLGWKFHHDDLQQCISTKTIESIAAATAKTQQLITASDSGAASEKERRAQVVEHAFEREACVFATSGWWSYQVCYKQEVRQFHEEPDGSRPSDWSMGIFVPPANTVDTPDIGSDVVQYFAGGQHCDENGEQRSTKVVYTCCKSKPAAVTIDSVEEPTLCSYIINVCVPDLCTEVDDVADLESAHELRKHAETCERELTAAAQPPLESADTPAPAASGSAVTTRSPPLSFTALRWATVILEDSSELDWARSMQFSA